MQSKQVYLLLQHVQSLHPAALKKNYLFYGQIKTKGIWDDPKEFIPWVLALMIFVPCALLLKDLFILCFENISPFRAQACAILSLQLFLMSINPLIIKQIKHSSHSVYHHLRHTPIKLTVTILLSGLNIAFLQNLFCMWLLLFITVSFGFVRFYKENLFRTQSNDAEYYQLQQLRRACFWAYKQTRILRFKLIFCTARSKAYNQLKQQLNEYADLHTHLFNAEHQFCKKIKHVNVDSYLDEML